MTADTSLIVLNDGRYAIELYAGYPSDDAPGFLYRRCAVSC